MYFGGNIDGCHCLNLKRVLPQRRSTGDESTEHSQARYSQATTMQIIYPSTFVVPNFAQLNLFVGHLTSAFCVTLIR